MKLLPPKELNTKLNEQKKSEIDSGLFLAKKVDALREQLADARLEHDAALQGMNKEYELFLGEFATKKSSLEIEIAYAEAKLAQLQTPLDAEWEKANELTTKNTEHSRLLGEKELTLCKREGIITQIERQIQKTKACTEDSLSEAQKIKEETKTLFILREKELSDTHDERLQFQKEYENTLLSIKNKERRLEYDIKHYKDFVSRLKEKEKELNLRETRLSIKENAKYN